MKTLERVIVYGLLVAGMTYGGIRWITPNRPACWYTRNAMISREIKNNPELIFVGDSITQGWLIADTEFDEFYGDYKAVNMGISGGSTQDTLYRLRNGNLTGISPKLAVVMIGTNDTGSAQEVAEGIVDVCQCIRERCPETKILLLAIFPRDEYPSPRRVRNAEASLLASKIADDKTVFYLDINDKFLTEDGRLKQEYFPDFLHPNDKGYKVWAEAMEPTIEKMWGVSK